MRIFIVILTILTAWLEAGGTTIRVPQDQATIQGGINSAVNGDTVLVGPGVWTENIIFGGRNITVMSSKGPENTTIQASNPDEAVVRIINAETRSAVLKGFKITGGGRSGILCAHSSPSIIGNIVTGNSGSSARAWGGGITLDYTVGCMVAYNKSFANFPSDYGGGIHVERGTNDTLRYNLVYGNTGFSAIWCHDAKTAILNNTVFHSVVDYWSSLVTLNDENADAIIDIRNNVFHGPCSWGVRSASGAIFSNYNIFWDVNQTYGLYVTGMIGDITADPVLIDPGSADYHLTIGSPCIDAGDPNPFFNDLDGSRNDIGAFPLREWKAGDVDGNGVVNVSDVVHLLNYIFAAGPVPEPLEAGDCNCDGQYNISDIVYMVNYIFSGGQPPCYP